MCRNCRKPGCRLARPLCRAMRAKSAKYRVCTCHVAHYPHRAGWCEKAGLIAINFLTYGPGEDS